MSVLQTSTGEQRPPRPERAGNTRLNKQNLKTGSTGWQLHRSVHVDGADTEEMIQSYTAAYEIYKQ